MTRISLSVVTILTLSSGAVQADVIPPDVYACNNLGTGSPCDSGMGAGAGVCQDSTCSRADYAHWDRDASAMPPTTSYGCKKCVPKGTATKTNATTATDTATATATNATTATDTATVTNTTTSTVTVKATDPGTDSQEDSKDSSGCSVSGARVIAPWLLAGIFAACVSLLRRRPRR